MDETISFQSFNAKASGYDPNNALILAQVCADSYRREKVAKLAGKNETNDQWRERVKEEAATQGFDSDHVYCFNNKGSQAMLLADAEKVILAFRGSEEKADWNANLNRREDMIFKGRFKASLHTGFIAYLIAVWEPYSDPQGRVESKGIKALLKQEMQDGTKSLWITGHSLGGAAATLAAAACMIQEPPIPVSGVYTYGQPRVGDSRFADLYNSRLKSKTFRFVNNNDVVTKVPSWAPYFFYSHVGQIKYLTNDGEIIDFEKLSWWGRLRDAVSGIADDLFDEGLDSITDHSMTTGYIPPLRKALSGPNPS